jgi:hypothetical protein
VPIEQEKKRDVIHNITMLLRQTKLAGQVDVQRMGMAFSLVLDEVEAGQPVDLTSLYDWLVREAKMDERAVVEVCVVLKAREQKLGVDLKLPQKLEGLSAEVVEQILEKFNASAGKSATFDRREVSGKSAASPGPKSSFQPKKGAQRKEGTDRRLVGVFVVLLLACGGYWGYALSTREPPLQEIPSADPTWLPCAPLKVNRRVAVCTIPVALWKQDGEALRSRAEIMKRALARDHNTEILYVQTAEDTKTRMRL